MLEKKRVEEFMRLKSSIQEEGGGGQQAGAEDSPEEHTSPEVIIEPAPQTPLDRLVVIINQNKQSSHEEDDKVQSTNIQANHDLHAEAAQSKKSLP
jgi:hypothetical protein